MKYIVDPQTCKIVDISQPAIYDEYEHLIRLDIIIVYDDIDRAKYIQKIAINETVNNLECDLIGIENGISYMNSQLSHMKKLRSDKRIEIEILKNMIE
ncbi:hypothetical protein [Elizabethkingia phage TCUEAP1]|nr:hypothetical protein [Elizabethkingia phage TCUEAP1]